jgi:hypothetical protein
MHAGHEEKLRGRKEQSHLAADKICIILLMYSSQLKEKAFDCSDQFKNGMLEFQVGLLKPTDFTNSNTVNEVYHLCIHTRTRGLIHTGFVCSST